MPHTTTIHPAGPAQVCAAVALVCAALAFCPAAADAAQPHAGATSAPTDSSPAGADELLRRLAELQSRLADASLADAERLDAERRAVDVRIALADARPGDDLAATWLIDAAAGVLEPLGRDGSQASVLLGVPTDAQRAACESAAKRGLELLARAQAAADAAVERLQADLLDPAKKNRAAAESQRVEARLAALVDVEQTQRIPYHTGVCQALLAACANDAPSRTEHVRAAVTALSDREIGSMTGEAARRVALAAALLLEPRGLDELREAALEQLAWVTQRARQAWGGDAPDAAASVGRLTALAARMGEIVATRPPASIDDAREEVAAAAARGDSSSLLLAEAHARVILADPARRFANAAERSAAAAGLVLEAYQAMPDATDAEHARRERVRHAAYEKVAALTPASVLAAATRARGTGLPAEVALANAVVLSRRAAEAGGEGEGDAEFKAAARAQAAALLESLVKREDLSPPALRGDALWELAVLESQSDEPADNARAMEALLDLAYAPSGEGRQSRAALQRSAKAVSAGAELGRYVSAQPSVRADAALAARVRRAYRPLLQMMLAREDVATPGVWRAELARVILDDALAATSGAVTLATLDEVLAQLKPVRDAAVAESGAAQTAARAIDAARSSAEAALREAEQTGDAQAKDAARRGVIRVQERALAWQLDHADPAAAATRLRLAEMLLEVGDPRAMEHLPPLADADGPRPGVDPFRLRLAQARAERLAGKTEQAFQHLLALATDLDRPVGVEGQPAYAPRPPLFWAAWCELLEILAADNHAGDAGDRSGTIRLHIRNLELIDRSLGGGVWEKRIRAVEASL